MSASARERADRALRKHTPGSAADRVSELGRLDHTPSWSSCRRGRCPRSAARRHARAVARRGARARPALCPPRRGRASCWRCIPFGAARRRQMLAYSRPPLRHDTALAARPQGDRPALHRELDVTSRRGTPSRPTRPTWSSASGPACARTSSSTATATITQLVPLRLRCRHTIGLNHVAIGDGARRRLRCGHQRTGADARFAAADALASGTVRDPLAGRDRARREPVQPIPPRALSPRCATARTATSPAATMRRYRARL